MIGFQQDCAIGLHNQGTRHPSSLNQQHSANSRNRQGSLGFFLGVLASKSIRGNTQWSQFKFLLGAVLQLNPELDQQFVLQCKLQLAQNVVLLHFNVGAREQLFT